MLSVAIGAASLLLFAPKKAVVPETNGVTGNVVVVTPEGKQEKVDPENKKGSGIQGTQIGKDTVIVTHPDGSREVRRLPPPKHAP
jgi:hypothetical protein